MQQLANSIIKQSGQKFLGGIGLYAQAAPQALLLLELPTYSGTAKSFLKEHYEPLRAKLNLPPSALKPRGKKRRKTYQPTRSKAVSVGGIDVTSNEFLQTYEWRKVRMEALKKYGPVCQCCGATPKTGAVMNVDHIKPRKLFPSLALDVNNLQILCHECNHGKGNWDQTDWRGDAV
jgi:hypothetical protein